MIRIRALGTLLLVTFLVALPTGAGAVQADKAKPKHVFLWSVKGKGCTAFLLGSLHASTRGLYPLDDRILKAYASCPRGVFEADINEAGSAKAREMMRERGTYPKGQTLQQNVSAKTYRMLEERFKPLGLEEGRFAQMRPWLVSVTLAGLELKRLGFDAGNGIDAHFLRKARTEGKKVVFFETAGQQIDMLARALSNRQEDLLRQTMEELDVIRQSSTDLESAWKRGDAARIEALTRKSLKGYPVIEKKLFVERNTAWTGKIEKLLAQEGDVLVVVGAAHLVGDNGLIELLRRKGYEPVQE